MRNTGRRGRAGKARSRGAVELLRVLKVVLKRRVEGVLLKDGGAAEKRHRGAVKLLAVLEWPVEGIFLKGRGLLEVVVLRVLV